MDREGNTEGNIEGNREGNKEGWGSDSCRFYNINAQYRMEGGGESQEFQNS